jgi:phosphohistidine phosphatase
VEQIDSMKTLFVLRHAKSSWDNSRLSDFERPLNDRGEETAPFMGKVMARKHFKPDLIMSSPAERAKQTAKLSRKAAKLDCPLEFDERIYEASPQALRKVVSETANDKNSLMIVGHNPGMEGFVRLLTGKEEAMPTASLAVIELDIDDWKDIAPAAGMLVEILRPKEID